MTSVKPVNTGIIGRDSQSVLDMMFQSYLANDNKKSFEKPPLHCLA